MPQLLEFKYTSYLEHATKQYKKVVFVNLMPEDNELKKYIKIGSRPKLSSFQYDTNTDCMYFVLNPNNKSELLEVENMGLLFNLLINNGFQLHSTFSEIIKNDPKFICYASK